MIKAVGVVIPAHNEEDLLPSCLDGRSGRSAGRGAARPPGPCWSWWPTRAPTGPRNWPAPAGRRSWRSGPAAWAPPARGRAGGAPPDRGTWIRPRCGWPRPTPTRWSRPAGSAGSSATPSAGWDAVVGTVTVTDWPAAPARGAASIPAALRDGQGDPPARARGQPGLPRRRLPGGGRLPALPDRRGPRPGQVARRRGPPGPAHHHGQRGDLGPAPRPGAARLQPPATTLSAPAEVQAAEA